MGNSNLHDRRSVGLFNRAVVDPVAARRRYALLGLVSSQRRRRFAAGSQSDCRARRVLHASRLPTALHRWRPILHPRLEAFLRDVRRGADRHTVDPLFAPGHVPVVRLDAEMAAARRARALLVGPRWRVRRDGRATLLLHRRVHLKFIDISVSLLLCLLLILLFFERYSATREKSEASRKSSSTSAGIYSLLTQFNVRCTKFWMFDRGCGNLD